MFNVCLSVMVSNLRNRGKAGEFSPFFVVLMDFWNRILCQILCVNVSF